MSSESAANVEATASGSAPAPAASGSVSASNRRRSSVLSLEKQQELERRLQNRPDKEHLENTGIVKDGGRFAAERARLARELNQDAVARAIDQRPSLDDLEASNIVESRPVAPVLAAVAKQLERNIIADTLNQKLYAREDIDELERRELIKSGDVAPRLRGAKQALEHALTRDQVGHLLEMRPEPDDLVRANVLPTPLSGKIAASAKQLAHRMTVDRVGHLLEKRSEIDHLQTANVLKDVRVAPALQGAQKNLEKNLAKANLYHALKYRPSIEEIVRRGILEEDEETIRQRQYAEWKAEQEQAQEREYRAFVLAKQAEYARASEAAQAQAQYQAQAQAQSQYYSNSQSAPAPSYQSYSSYSSSSQYDPSGYQRRSRSFHLTRILLKFIPAMAEAGEISLQQKGFLKDLVVDQDRTILAMAEQFDSENDLNDFKDSLLRLAQRR